MNAANLEDRIGQLEQSIRRLRVYLILVGLGLIGAVLFATARPQTPRIIEAEAFRVMDSRGKPRITLNLSKGDEPTIGLIGSQGQMAILSEQSPGSMVLGFSGRDSHLRWYGGVDENNSPVQGTIEPVNKLH